MNLILSKGLENLSAPLVVVCEGMGDVHLVKSLLKHHQLNTCQVGCPSTDGAGAGMGKSKIGEYLDAVMTAAKLGNLKLKGILVIGDADTSNRACFEEILTALQLAGLPCPAVSYSLEQFTQGDHPFYVGSYVIPGKGRDGTLEHLLLESVDYSKRMCVDSFLACVGIPEDLSPNELAKMKMSSIVGASCRKNPWASVAYMFSDRLNPVSIDSPCFQELVELLKEFAAVAI